MDLQHFIVITARRNLCEEHKEATETLCADSGLFAVKTCLRNVWIVEEKPKTVAPLLLAREAGFDILRESAAYEFLLRFGCGLESFVPGENEVFGQFKKAWATFHDESLVHANVEILKFLNPIIQRIFSDIREIRRTNLQNIGSSSYASISRKLLSPQDGDRVLVIGTGKLAQSAAPLLQKYNLAVWGRDQEKLETFSAHFEAKYAKSFTNVSDEDLDRFIKTSTHILLCIPKVEELEKTIQRLNPAAKVVHLGAEKHECCEGWINRPHGKFWGLDDVFQEEKIQLSQKSDIINQAKQACHSKALYRSRKSCSDNVSISTPQQFLHEA